MNSLNQCQTTNNLDAGLKGTPLKGTGMRSMRFDNPQTGKNLIHIDGKYGRIRIGKKEAAQYKEQQVPAYRGKPLIEALPQILSVKDAITQLRHLPTIDHEDRTLPPEIRLHLIETAFQELFQPLPTHIELEQRISRTIRAGYIARDPFAQGYHQEKEAKLKQINQYHPVAQHWPSSSLGFTSIGLSGMGKTTGHERTLSLYPQIITHSAYQGHDFNFTQLVWVHLECPPDGSTRSFCLSFLETVGTIVGEDLLARYGKGKPTTDELIISMSRVAANYGLGLLAMDELQNLSAAKSGGTDIFLNFLVQLVNVLGLPIVLIGTSEAATALGGKLRLARRGTGQGALRWNQMDKKDGDWTLLLKTMWRYQYVQNPTKLTDKLNDVIYEETQGITDLVVKIFKFAQWRAITTGKEQLSEALIKSVAKDSFGEVRPILKALKCKNYSRLLSLGDVVMPSDQAIIDQLSASDSSFAEKVRTILQKSLHAEAPTQDEAPTVENASVPPYTKEGNTTEACVPEGSSKSSAGNSHDPSYATAPHGPDEANDKTSASNTSEPPAPPKLEEIFREGRERGEALHDILFREGLTIGEYELGSVVG